jgi:hypothetical protein
VASSAVLVLSFFGASCGVIAIAAATNDVGSRSAFGEKCVWGDEIKC